MHVKGEHPLVRALCEVRRHRYAPIFLRLIPLFIYSPYAAGMPLSNTPYAAGMPLFPHALSNYSPRRYPTTHLGALSSYALSQVCRHRLPRSPCVNAHVHTCARVRRAGAEKC